jgi:hypothetical protein
MLLNIVAFLDSFDIYGLYPNEWYKSRYCQFNIIWNSHQGEKKPTFSVGGKDFPNLVRAATYLYLNNIGIHSAYWQPNTDGINDIVLGGVQPWEQELQDFVISLAPSARKVVNFDGTFDNWTLNACVRDEFSTVDVEQIRRVIALHEIFCEMYKEFSQK